MAKNPKEKTKGIRKVRAQGGDSKFVPIAMALHKLFDVPDKRIVASEDGEDDIGLNFKVIAMTDEGLLRTINDLVAPEERIDERTWRRYKNGDVSGISTDEMYYVGLFMSAYKKAIDVQRFALARALADDVPGGWQRYAWLLERKFDDFNLRAKSVDETPDVGRLVVRVKT